MKRPLLIATFICLLPLTVLANAVNQPEGFQLKQRQHELNGQVKGQIKDQVKNKVNQQIQRPALERVHEFKATTPKEAFEFHTTVLEQRIARLEQSSIIPEEKRADLIAKFTEELDWLKSKQAELEAAETPEAKATIKQEIIDHVKTQREQRRSELAETVTIPKTSPTELTDKITERFNLIEAQLADAGKDTAELATAMAAYQQSVTDLTTAVTAVEASKTIETLQALKDAIQNTRSAVTEVRNVLQSIVKTEN